MGLSIILCKLFSRLLPEGRKKLNFTVNADRCGLERTQIAGAASGPNFVRGLSIYG
jgi:hypothetical protein